MEMKNARLKMNENEMMSRWAFQYFHYRYPPWSSLGALDLVPEVSSSSSSWFAPRSCASLRTLYISTHYQSPSEATYPPRSFHSGSSIAIELDPYSDNIVDKENDYGLCPDTKALQRTSLGHTSNTSSRDAWWSRPLRGKWCEKKKKKNEVRKRERNGNAFGKASICVNGPFISSFCSKRKCAIQKRERERKKTKIKQNCDLYHNIYSSSSKHATECRWQLCAARRFNRRNGRCFCVHKRSKKKEKKNMRRRKKVLVNESNRVIDEWQAVKNLAISQPRIDHVVQLPMAIKKEERYVSSIIKNK